MKYWLVISRLVAGLVVGLLGWFAVVTIRTAASMAAEYVRDRYGVTWG